MLFHYLHIYFELICETLYENNKTANLTKTFLVLICDLEIFQEKDIVNSGSNFHL